MNNPVRAYEHSEWQSAGYCHHPCVIVCKTGFCDFRVFQTPVSVGGLQPRTSCLRHSYGVTLFRGIKPLNPCSARLSLYRQKDRDTKRSRLRFFIDIRTKGTQALACVYFLDIRTKGTYISVRSTGRSSVRSENE